MPNYRRAFILGIEFFTVNLLRRHNNNCWPHFTGMLPVGYILRIGVVMWVLWWWR